MNRWTINELNSLSNYKFAEGILHERLFKLSPYSPLAAKLSEAAVEIGAAGERERKCFECESETCAYNHGGVCRFARVHEGAPFRHDGVCTAYILLNKEE